MKILLFFIGRVINLLFVFALLIANLSVFIPPSFTLVPAFFGLAFSILIYINLFFLLFWIYQKKTFLLWSLIALAISYPNFSQTIRFSSAQKADVPDERFQVLSYNIRYFDRFNWSGKEDTRRLMMNYILESEAQVICLQEYIPLKQDSSYRQFMTLMKKKGYSQHYESIDEKSGIGLITFSQFPIKKREKIIFDSSNNACIYTDVKINSQLVRIFNLHLQSIYFDRSEYALFESFNLQERDKNVEKVKRIWTLLGEAWKKREFQAEKIQLELQTSPFPFILAGDFNDSPVSYAYRTVKSDYKDAFLESGKGLSNTYTKLLAGLRIDFLIHSNEIESFDYQKDTKDYSDHFPVHANFSLPTSEIAH